jgi:hypothetical protein
MAGNCPTTKTFGQNVLNLEAGNIGMNSELHIYLE